MRKPSYGENSPLHLVIPSATQQAVQSSSKTQPNQGPDGPRLLPGPVLRMRVVHLSALELRTHAPYEASLILKLLSYPNHESPRMSHIDSFGNPDGRAQSL
jgi:hypothetical protein